MRARPYRLRFFSSSLNATPCPDVVANGSKTLHGTRGEIPRPELSAESRKGQGNRG